MNKKIIIAVSALVTIGAGTLLVRNFIKNDKNSDSSKTRGGSSGGSRGGSTSDGNNATSIGMAEIKGDAQKIYSALNLWTTDNDEKIIVERISKYSPSAFKKLEKWFNQEFEFKVGNSIKNDPLKEWLEEDLSDENYEKIRSIVG